MMNWGLAATLVCGASVFTACTSNDDNPAPQSDLNLWLICIIDMIIAALYNLDIYLEPTSEYTNYMLTEIWIRPTITYGLVACFVTEVETARK